MKEDLILILDDNLDLKTVRQQRPPPQGERQWEPKRMFPVIVSTATG